MMQIIPLLRTLTFNRAPHTKRVLVFEDMQADQEYVIRG